MSKVGEESMNSIERVQSVLELKEPDRVPVWSLIDYMPKKYYDITAEELVFDAEKSQESYERLFNELGGFDIAVSGGAMFAIHINPFPIIFSGYYNDWLLPGRTLPKDLPPQLAERSVNDPVLKVEDYDYIIENGFTDYIQFKDAKFRDLLKLSKIGKLLEGYTEKWWNEYKVPTFAEGASYLPFEVLSYLRGSTNFMKDIYRHPDKIKEVCDFMIDGMIAVGEFVTNLSHGRSILIGCIRSSADFISDKHFEEFCLPYLKKMVSKYLEDGYIVQLHCDTNWTPRLHYFKELPKGKVYFHMDERTDIVKAKEVLGDHMCIQGNLKPSLFTLGTPHQIEKETKRIIDECGEGGGLWIGSEIPDDAKMENVKAMIDTCKTYGQYRK